MHLMYIMLFIFKKKEDIMLYNIVKYGNENSVFSLILLISTTICFLKLCFTSMKNMKNKKKYKVSNNQKMIMEIVLNEQINFSEISKNIEKSRVIYQELYKQKNFDISKKRKKIFLSKIICKEENRTNEKRKPAIVKQKMDIEEKIKTKIAWETIKKISELFIDDKLKKLTIILLLFKAILYLLNKLVRDFKNKILLLEFITYQKAGKQRYDCLC